MKKVTLPALCAVALLTVGCTTIPSNYVASSIPVEQGRYTVVAEKVTGTDSQVNILGFGASRIGSSQNRAIDDALRQAPGANALVGMSIDIETKNLLVAMVITTRVTGTAVKTND